MDVMKIFFFASGAGSNVDNILSFFKNKDLAIDAKIYYNTLGAKVTDVADKHGFPAVKVSKEDLSNNRFIEELKKEAPDLIILAGFLLLVPKVFTDTFVNQIVNIHPSLLPKYGGKGMYGKNVHKAVVEAKEKESGITIHFVNEEYDKGAYIAQFKTSIDPTDDADLVEQKVRELERKYFPEVIFNLIK